MAIYTTADYQVKPAGVEKVKRAIEEFVPYAVKRFEAAYGPELAAGPVNFTDYRLIATNQE